MATEHPNEKKTRTAAETVESGAQQEYPSRPQQQSAPSSDDGSVSEVGEISASAVDSSGNAPPLPDEAPPLPEEAPPDDDGWYHEWEPTANRWVFINRYTGKSQWENPRVPEANAVGYGSYDSHVNDTAPGITTTSGAPGTSSPPRRLYGGYNPAIHGSYDPNADYALEAQKEEEEAEAAMAAASAAATTATAATLANPSQDYTTAAHFNRFTGKFQDASVNPDNHNDANKSRRQMTAFFDVDAAANSHDGRSLKAERRGKNLSKKELKAFKDKRREKKEEKRRAWLLD